MNIHARGKYSLLLMFISCILNKYVYLVPAFLFTPHHTHTPNQELHMQPQLPKFYHNDTLLYCILSF